MRIGSTVNWVGAVLLGLSAAACSRVEGGQGEGEESPASVMAQRPRSDSVEVLVYKSPTCGCCSAWVEHLRENGFTVVTKDVTDVTEVKQTAGVPRDLFSCHTAIVEGYAIEGHVPADLIRQFLAERSGEAGLAVPGMPMGSPGMEGSRRDRYDVIAFARDGTRRVYATR
jgi:hypothetical protein